MGLMQLIEILAIPMLMICDYYLTIIGNKLRLEGYSSHFAISDYELNPMWVKDINKHKLLNLKHLSIVFLATLLLFYIGMTENHSIFYKLFYGALLTNFMIVNSRHITNIMLFRYIRNNHGQIRGQITLSEEYVYTQSAIQIFACTILIVPLALLTRSFYVYGALIGSLSLILAQMYWYKRKRHRKEKVS